MRRVTLFIFLVCWLFSFAGSYAQEGDLFLTHHHHNIPGLDDVNYQIKSDSKGQLYIANRSGVIQYDGNTWRHVSTPSAAVSLDLHGNDQLYVGCVGDFGLLSIVDKKLQYQSLDSVADDDGLYFQTSYLNSSVYFVNEETIVRYDVLTSAISRTSLADYDDFFTKLFVVDGKILVQTDKELYEYISDELVSFTWPESNSYEFIFFEKHPSEDVYLAGTTDNEIYIYEQGVFTLSQVSDLLFNNDSFVDNGIWVDDNNFALSTLENGAILYDYRQNRTIEVINREKGLPDNEVHAIGVDREHGLWISHEFGLSRMELGIPFKTFSNFQGLHGHLYEAFFYDSSLYVATSEGVYHLTKVERYKNVPYYETVKKRIIKSVPQESAAKDSMEEGEEQEKKVEEQPQRVLSKREQRIARRKAKKAKKEAERNNEPEEKEPEEHKNKPSQNIYKPVEQVTIISKNVRLRKMRKELVGEEWVFKHVDGIHSKTERFFIYQEELYAAGSSGVFYINADSAEMVIHEPVRFVTLEKKHDRLIVGNMYNEVKIYYKEDDEWVETENLNLHGDLVKTAFNDENGRTWFATPTALIEFDDITVDHFDYKIFKYKNQFIDNPKLTFLNDRLYLINSEGYFYLDSTKLKVVPDVEMMQLLGKPVKHLQQRDGEVWVFNGKNWYKIDHEKNIEMMDVFGLFPDMSYVSVYNDRHWVIDDANELLEYHQSIDDSLFTMSRSFIRRAISNKGDIFLNGTMVFDYDENTFNFELSKPDYRGILNTTYQYRLTGVDDNWSEWSSNSQITLSYLQPGSYSLDIRAQDAFGNVEQLESFNFEIEPPYWQTLWFYSLQILVMILLVVISGIMNRFAREKYIIITEVLTVLALVLIIEFLQAIAVNYFNVQSSPVVDLGINVLIAFCIFPLEQALKRYLKAEENKAKGLAGKGFLEIIGVPNPFAPSKKDIKENSN
ncbi:MAG: triple tyrosine motif-containing protein [Reichenbachiella sp.]|uniref:triple tyrosine motif-containing protein n=1 Tax=Reichenbachiella sp. TaxID=2184521 RepID=UPI003298819E